MPRLVALTGGVGAGKSTVAARFARLGVPVVDADQISRSLTAAGGAAMAAIEALFGAAFILPDGALDRAAMRAFVFGDSTARNRLEAILHPMIRQEITLAVARYVDQPYVLLEVPLLFESMFYRDQLLASIVVDCPVGDQIARVISRDHLPRAQVEQIVATQIRRALRLQLADYVICNAGSPANVSVDALHGVILAACVARPATLRAS